MTWIWLRDIALELRLELNTLKWQDSDDWAHVKGVTITREPRRPTLVVADILLPGQIRFIQIDGTLEI